jgi:acyl dehydratase
VTHYFEDFHAGQVFTSQARTITETDVVTFAGWSWDANPVHTDAESAASGRFGERIAHGVLGLSVALGLASRLGVFESCSVALLGIDDWRFRRPLVPGDTVRCRVEILDTRLTSSGGTGVLQRRFTLLNQRDEVVQEGEIGLMVHVRPRG